MKVIRQLRRRAKLSQEELAVKVGVTRQAVIAWEQGAWPSAMLVPRIAAALNCELAELYAEQICPADEEDLQDQGMIQF